MLCLPLRLEQLYTTLCDESILRDKTPTKYGFVQEPSTLMQNEGGKLVDLYIPRKCAATNRLISADERGACQLSVGLVNEEGVFNGDVFSFTIAGPIRASADSDEALNELFRKRSLLKTV